MFLVQKGHASFSHVGGMSAFFGGDSLGGGCRGIQQEHSLNVGVLP